MKPASQQTGYINLLKKAYHCEKANETTPQSSIKFLKKSSCKIHYNNINSIPRAGETPGILDSGLDKQN
jgi:hypothetical protein